MWQVIYWNLQGQKLSPKGGDDLPHHVSFSFSKHIKYINVIRSASENYFWRELDLPWHLGSLCFEVYKWKGHFNMLYYFKWFLVDMLSAIGILVVFLLVALPHRPQNLVAPLYNSLATRIKSHLRPTWISYCTSLLSIVWCIEVFTGQPLWLAEGRLFPVE